MAIIHTPLAIKAWFISFLMLSLCSCGGGDSDELSGTYSVEDVNILSNNIEVGEQVRVEVFFESKTEPDGTSDGLDLIVRVPPELHFVPGSSELYDNSTSNSDGFTPNNIVECPSGETFLIYNFSDFDLFDHDLSAFGKFGIKFLAQGTSVTSQTLIGASAGKNENFNCGEFFSAEQNEAVEVLR